MSGVLRPAPGTLVFALVVVGPVVALVPRGCLGVAARAAPPRWRSFPLDRGAAVPDRPANLGRCHAPFCPAGPWHAGPTRPARATRRDGALWLRAQPDVCRRPGDDLRPGVVPG